MSSTRIGGEAPAPGGTPGLNRPGSWFSIVGTIEDVPVRADWSNGVLSVDDLLRERGLLLVALGERFVYEDPAANFTATLDGRAGPVLLTLIRACDRVHEVRFGVPGRDGRPLLVRFGAQTGAVSGS